MKVVRIIFLQGDNANEALDTLNEQGKDAALDFLSQWDYGEETEVFTELAAGSTDRIYEKNDYVLTYNNSLGYIGLERKL
jgi:hypothetical protein